MFPGKRGRIQTPQLLSRLTKNQKFLKYLSFVFVSFWCFYYDMQMEMEMQREWLNENCKQSQFCNDFDHGEWEELHLPAVSCNGDGPRYKKNSLLVSTTNVYPFPFSSSSTTTTASSGGFSFIQHPVSRLDTLAGIAIKYGVEVHLSFILGSRFSFCTIFYWVFVYIFNLGLFVSHLLCI